ncbi:MAG: hypothetical protein NW223_08010 [Hyphomicrobiaceae bacterium]|nr:hypothetical protein [Hyphomicrobiaceae bacterium]
MISVQSAMLVALGFLAASLLGLLIGSALWARAVRLTTSRLKQTMPVSEEEIKADRDRMRAEFAIRVHKLETALEQARMERARQFIEINRRDASISDLERSIGDLRTQLDEHVNARRVLEQTVADRLPRVEARLAEAKRLLFNRDREIAELTSGAKRHQLALEEASALTQQQSAKIERLTSALNGKGVPEPPAAHEADTARSGEIETLRTRMREQAALIERLQQRLARSSGAAAEDGAGATREEIERLKRRAADAERAVEAIRAATSDEDAARLAFADEIRTLKASAEDQQAEIARLKAALDTYDRFEGDPGQVRENKLMLKARLGSAQAHSDQQTATIGRLRAELAASHERMARQAAHFMEEIRRISQAGQIGAAQPLRRRAGRPGEDKIAERVARVLAVPSDAAERNGGVQEMAREIKRAQAAVVTGEAQEELGLQEVADTSAAAPQGGDAAASEAARDAAAGSGEPAAAGAAQGAAAVEMPQGPAILEERRRPRLLDRLSGLAKG